MYIPFICIYIYIIFYIYIYYIIDKGSSQNIFTLKMLLDFSLITTYICIFIYNIL